MSTDAILQDILNELRRGGTGSGGQQAAPPDPGAFNKLTAAATSAANGLMNFGIKAADANVGLSDLANVVPKLPGAFGLLNVALNAAVSMVEKNVATYQNLSNAGINFGGSLNQMRLSATSMYMTMDQFAGFMSKNADTFTRLGGGANAGAEAFVKLGSALVKSEAGDNLRALGYTSEQLNQGLATYLSLTGGRTRDELKNSKEILAGSQRYLEQLDRMADITGQSRDQLEKDLKRKQEEADIEIMKANMTVQEREAFNSALQTYGALYGKAGEDMVVAAAQGRVVATEEGKKLAALAPNLAEKINQSYQTNLKYGAQSKQALDLERDSRLAAQQDLRRFGGTLGTVGGLTKGLEKAFVTSAKDIQAGATTRKAIDDQEMARSIANAERAKSDAAQFIKLQTQIKEFGLQIYTFMIPGFNFLMKAVVEGANMFKNVIGEFVVPFFKKLDFSGTMKPFLDFWDKLRSAVTAMDWAGIGEAAKVTFDKFWTAAKEVLQPLFEKASTLFTTIGNDLGPVFQDVGDIFKLVFERIQDVIDIMKTYIWPVLEPIAGGLMDAMLPMWNVFKLLINSIKALLSGDFAKVGENFGKIWDELASALEMITKGIGGAVGKVMSFFGGSSSTPTGPEPPKAAIGGIYSGPTSGYPIIAHGTEAVAPIKTGNGADAAKALGMASAAGGSENLVAYLQTLNSISAEMLKYMKETADYTRRNVDATRSLNGNLFPTA